MVSVVVVRKHRQTHAKIPRSMNRVVQLRKSLIYAHGIQRGDIVAVRNDKDPYGFWLAEVQAPPCYLLTQHAEKQAERDVACKNKDPFNGPLLDLLGGGTTNVYTFYGNYVLHVRWYDRFRCQMFTLLGSDNTEPVNVECLIVLPPDIKLALQFTSGRELAARGQYTLPLVLARSILSVGNHVPVEVLVTAAVATNVETLQELCVD